MGDDGSTMGGRMVEGLQWAMRWRQRDTIGTDAEAAQREFVFKFLFWLGKLPPTPDYHYSFGFS
jgi:hypothetical protein